MKRTIKNRENRETSQSQILLSGFVAHLHISIGICLVEGESQFNSNAVGQLNWDKSKDLGLFQISEKWWCRWGKKRLTGCRIKCEGKKEDFSKNM